MSSFEIIDRRGQNKEPRVDPVEVKPAAVTGEWQDVAFVIALLPQRDGSQIVIGRAIGLREDGLTFVADYWFPFIWPEDLEWTEKARERLDTFRECQCESHAPCSIHQMYIRQWMEADYQRVALSASGNPPLALAAYLRAEEAASRSKIITPR